MSQDELVRLANDQSTLKLDRECAKWLLIEKSEKRRRKLKGGNGKKSKNSKEPSVTAEAIAVADAGNRSQGRPALIGSGNELIVLGTPWGQQQAGQEEGFWIECQAATGK